MKKIISFLVILTTFTNVSYASFAVVDTLEVKQDTLKVEVNEINSEDVEELKNSEDKRLNFLEMILLSIVIFALFAFQIVYHFLKFIWLGLKWLGKGIVKPFK